MKITKYLFWLIIIQSMLWSTPEHMESPYPFTANDGTRVDAYRGSYWVPENRSEPNSRKIQIHYVRFPSTGNAEGIPTVYLAGGPGGSGIETAKGRRFPLFMAMREFGDVIALDQRGTGLSNDIPAYESQERPYLLQPLTHKAMASSLEQASIESAKFWKTKGIDISGYNTREGAKDIEDLRQALGAEQINLWGISYGSHLAMAAIREMPGRIHKVVMAGIEGMDHTVKLPSRTDAYFDRLQKVINEDPNSSRKYPDLKGLIKSVYEDLQKEPKIVNVKNPEGEDIELAIGKMELQILASTMIADPSRAVNLPRMFMGAKYGHYDSIAPLVYRFIKSSPIRFRGMPEAMDIMSGVSKERLQLFKAQVGEAILGTWLNYPMPQLIGGLGLNDLGDGFRQPVKTDVPTLAFSGTLDGRTYPESAKEALQGFSNLDHILVENGGHNIFMQEPIIMETILKFMRDEEVPEMIELDAPVFP